MWAYRSLTSVVGGPIPVFPLSLTKPFGFSSFFIEIGAFPRSWAEHLFPNLVLYKAHDKASRPMPKGTTQHSLDNGMLTLMCCQGGHFAALEQPQLFLKDLEDFLKLVAPNVTGSAH